MRKRSSAIVGLAVLFSLTLLAQAATTAVHGRVSRVIDGDTIVVDTVGTVRLISCRARQSPKEFACRGAHYQIVALLDRVAAS